MRFSIEFTAEAESDLDKTVEGIWEFSPTLAEDFADAYDRCVQQIMEFPESGQLEAAGRYTIRVGDSQFRLAYRFDGSAITVSGLINMRRLR